MAEQELQPFSDKIVPYKSDKNRPFLATVTAVFALCLLLNVGADPRQEFGTGLLPPLIDDARTEKLVLYEQDAPYDTVVIGVSTASLYRVDGEAGRLGRFFNFAVPGQQPNESLRLVQHLTNQPGGPGRLVISSDYLSWMKPRVASAETVAISGGQEFFPNRHPAPSQVLASAIEADYLRDSIRSVYYKATGYPQSHYSYTRFGAFGNDPPFFAYNSTHHSPENLAAARGKLLALYDAIWDSSEIDQNSTIKELEQYAQLTRGMKLVLIINPMSQDYINHYESISPGFLERGRKLVDEFRSRCAAGEEIYDFLDGPAAGFSSEDFPDGFHFDTKVADAVMERVQKHEGDLCQQP